MAIAPRALAWYRGYSKLRTHTVLGPYGRSIRTFLRAVRVLTFESPLYPFSGEYRGTSLLRNNPFVGPFNGPMPRDLW